jgi:HSP20 family molecular chaperone IbpA
MTAKYQKTARPQILDSAAVVSRMENLQRAIAERAYSLFELRGGEDGHDVEDWLTAESELIQPLELQIEETDSELNVQANVAGFQAENILLSIEPREVIISGTNEVSNESTGQKAAELFHTLRLPYEIDPNRATAGVREEVLYLTLPRVPE